MGMRLETCTLGWNDMYALLAASPPHTALHYFQNEKWDLKDHLLATSLDRLNVLLWTKTKDAAKKPPRNFPKRIPRPGVDERSQAPHMKDTVRDITEFMRLQKESGREAKMYHRGEGHGDEGN